MKNLTRREFLRIIAVAGGSVLLSKVPALEPDDSNIAVGMEHANDTLVIENEPGVIHGTDATLTINGETIPMVMGGYEFDLSDEAIKTLTVNKSTIIGKEFTITSIAPLYDDNELFGLPIKLFPDKDSEFCFEGRIVDYDSRLGIATAEFNGELVDKKMQVCYSLCR